MTIGLSRKNYGGIPASKSVQVPRHGNDHYPMLAAFTFCAMMLGSMCIISGVISFSFYVDRLNWLPNSCLVWDERISACNRQHRGRHQDQKTTAEWNVSLYDYVKQAGFQAIICEDFLNASWAEAALVSRHVNESYECWYRSRTSQVYIFKETASLSFF